MFSLLGKGELSDLSDPVSKVSVMDSNLPIYHMSGMLRVVSNRQ